ncbi:MAG: acetoacetate decarboxylase family protein [Clostridia bacterium]
MNNIISAPWELSGRGFITLYKFDKNFLSKTNIIPKFLKERRLKGFGAIMFVEYEESPVGPYYELLFIPGKFVIGNKKLATISKIYVSTQESVDGGINNWGIPKEIADFEVHDIDKSRTSITVEKDDQLIASFVFKETFMPIPVSTNILKYPLIQKRKDKFYLTDFKGSGKGKMAIIEEQKFNDKNFPNIENFTPIISVKVNPFNITFPKADIRKGIEIGKK